MNEATIAAHRFGLGESTLSAVHPDPRGWVLEQLRAPSPLDATGLESTADMRAIGRRVLQAALQPAEPQGSEQARSSVREAGLRDLQRRWHHRITTTTPVAERWIAFWANHFTVAATKGTTLGLVGPFEREAIRPLAFGRFADLLRAATLHPAMLLYLDNAVSFGAGSTAGRRRGGGLNENLARELLELHTLGVNGGYTQADVTETARLLTGWTVSRSRDRMDAADTSPDAAGAGRFVSALHEPGSKHILGRRYEEGPQAVNALLDDLARHPATARHLARKLAGHFVADEPPPTLVAAVAAAFQASDGDLATVARVLFTHELAWRTEGPGKLKRPEEWMLSAHRVLAWPIQAPAAAMRLATQLGEMGQPPNRAPSPQGWPDLQADWLGPDAIWKRIEWASQFAQAVGAGVDARAVAEASLGTGLGPATRREIERAESPTQALALFLASPEFLRR